jgi:two-component system sensor histidine kinase KdpD
LCAAAALLAAPLAHTLDIASLALVFMLAVVVAAALFGRGPALLAAGLSVLLLNVVFVPPRFSLAVADERLFFTFAVMLAVGLVVGQLTAGLKAQALAAQEREQRVRSLYEISRELGGALAVEQVAQAIARFANAQWGGSALLWVLARDGELLAVAAEEGAAPQDQAAWEALAPLARWAVTQGRAAGRGTEHQPDHPTLVLLLRAPMAVRGALAVQRADGLGWSADERRLLSTCATLLAGTLERLHYIDVAQATALEIEGERLRNTLLSALSHDLRTPLASLVGLAESLRLTRPAPSPQQAEIADAMAASARRMSALATNLLDMARLHAGAVRLDLQWQPLEEVVGSALAASAPWLAQHPVRVQLAEDLPWVRIDAVLVERVLVNLLENAVKYTPPGTWVAVSGVARAEGVELSVQDGGPGLPLGRGEDLFKKFERGEREGATPGVGLGLALCRAIVEAHGGTIHAESPASGGARFVVCFPRGLPPPLPPAEEAAAATEMAETAEMAEAAEAAEATPLSEGTAGPDGSREAPKGPAS